MKILDRELTEEFGTVKLTVLSNNNNKISMYIQTIDGVHRRGLKCVAYSGAKNVVLDEKDFDSKDIALLIKEAEDFMRNSYKIKYINPDYIFKIFNGKVMLSAVNHQFVSADASPYQQKYHDINLFNTLKEAEAFVATALKEGNQDELLAN